MAELLKLKQVRNGHRTHTKKLMDKCDTDLRQLQDMKMLLASLEKKQETLEKIDADILNGLTAEGDIENEIEDSSNYTDLIIEAKTKIQLAIEHFNRKYMESKFGGVHPTADTKPVVINKSETQIKLPKITLKAYDGSLLNWSNFWGQFDAAVNKNNDLTEIQKFTYLQSFLSGEAERAISGLTLIKENYSNAVDVLTERFGNKQARISAHMKELRVLSTVVDINDVIALRQMYDTLDLNISNLKELDVDVSTYGSLLIAIIFDCIPEELRIKISLRFGSKDWTLDETMNVFKTELEARERSMAISGNKQSNYESNNCYSTQSLHLNTVRENTRDRKVNHSASSPINKNKSSNFNNFNNKVNNNKPSNNKVVCCVFCKEKHLSSRCRNVTDINIRYNTVRRENRCFVCLKQNHRSKDCYLNYSCLKCNRRHNIALCPQQYERQDGSKLNGGACGRETLSNVAHIENLNEQQRTSESVITSSVEAGSTTNILVGSASKVCHHDEIILQCAMAEVCDIKEKRTSMASVLFDGGSQRTYLTDALRNRLGLQCIRKESLILKRFASSEGLLRCLDVVQVCLKGKGGASVYMEALCVPHICSPVKVPELSYMKTNYEYLRDIELASPPDASNNVNMLVGLDYYFSIVSGKTLRGPPGSPVAIESLLGWIICGRSNVPSTSGAVVTHLMLAEDVDVAMMDEIEELDLKEELKRFWEVENIAGDINDIHTKFNENIYYNGSRYVTSLPFKSRIDFVPDNFKISSKRLLCLLNKLKRNPELNEEYRRIIDTYERDGIIEKVYDSGVPGKVHYLPHRPVVRDDRDTTKVRIVFDGSAKEKGGKSINDLLDTGPCLLSNIYDILLRFCFGKIAIIADIRQAFLNIELCDEDKDYVRFLFTDPEDDSKVQIYRFNRVCFGITSSPFLLNATIQYHMNRLKDEEPGLSLKFLRDIYVDDVTSNVNSVEEGVRFCNFARLSMATAGFELHKWYSNSRELRHLMDSTEDDIERKVLGVIWNKNDEFVFDFRQLVEKALKLPLTKRNLLRIGATFYDPIGMISPVVLIAKIYFQKVCLDGLNWDDVLSGDLAKGWNQYLKQLAEIECITVPRYLFTDTNDTIISNITLHGFCDSSKQAYCAAIYVQTKSSDGTISRLLTSKTKVSPIKKLSIPRLELLSCLLLAELMSSVCKVLQDIVIIDKKLFWSDSEVALSWIKAEGKEWKPWVKNRVSKIRQMSDVDYWFYVSTDLNPSDIGTRESSVVKFAKNNLWWYGPLFLREEKKVEVKDAEKDDLQDVNSALVLSSVPEDVLNEVDSSVVMLVNSDADEKFGIGNIINFERYSNFMKLLRIVVYVKRFINNCLKGKKKEIGEIVVEETEEALKLCIVWEQRSIVADKRFSNLRKQLSLFFDTDGILRLQGRLENAHLKFDAKHPVLLNRHSYFTKLVILHAHLNVKHMRLKATLNEVRSRYWIPQGKQTVKSVIKDCYHCKYVIGKTIVGPPPPDLPQYRVCFEFAFTNVGIDYAGPLYVKEIYGVDFKMHKAYILLFTCAATRGVHLELCPDMSTPCLIRCLKRFISRRGKFDMAISDNFSTFVSAELKRFLLIEQIKWSHILPKSPWWGAFYERLIRIIKEALKKVVGKAKLTYEEMETVLGEIEVVINSRPLTYLYEEAEEALTPSHLVIGRRLLSNSMKGNNNTVEHSSDLLNNRYKYLQNVIEHYWKRFCKEYLFELREHHLYVNKGNYDEFCKLLLGDVVLIRDDSLKRNCWKKGRVEKMIYGKDNLVRGALLKICHGDKVSYLERPLQRIIPLEVQRERMNNDVNVGDANDEVGSNSTVHGDTEVDSLRDEDKTDNVNNTSQVRASDHSYDSGVMDNAHDSVNNYKKRLRSYQQSQVKCQ